MPNTHVQAAAEGLPFERPYASMSAAELFDAMRRLRAEAEHEIERLFVFLDRLDGDWDCECGGDPEPDVDGEPSLGWRGHGIGAQQGDGCYHRDEDLEGEHDGREPECEDEG